MAMMMVLFAPWATGEDDGDDDAEGVVSGALGGGGAT